MQDFHDLELMLGSHTPIIVIESQEEVRILQFLVQTSHKLPFPLFQWSVTEGLSRLDLDLDIIKNTRLAGEMLRHIKADTNPGYYTLLDFHPFTDDPVHIRLMKEIALSFSTTKKYLILISHQLQIPEEFRYLTARFNLRLPDRAALKKLIYDEAKHWKSQHGKNIKIQTDIPIIEHLASNLSGVTATDAKQLIRSAIAQDGAITASDLPEVMKAKYQLMAADGVISFEYDTARFSDVAGLKKLKTWLTRRAPSFGIQKKSKDQPKGIMLLGVQGCGKSLAARAVAGTFDVPLLRLDFSTLYNKYHGETERNLRNALHTADIMSPCVLWIDEIEKGLATGNSDGGISKRILGTMLTWMAERKSQVFIVATSNDISQLPPELVRKGRLDEIFFVDLPDAETRQEVFKIHLQNREQPLQKFDLSTLADASANFSGAEIEQAVVSALYTSQSQEDSLTTGLLLDELAETRPLAIVMSEPIAELRAWAKSRTVPAN